MTLVIITQNCPLYPLLISFFLKRNFKQTLIELERLYDILIEVEDCEKKLTALPTGTSMRLQVRT